MNSRLSTALTLITFFIVKGDVAVADETGDFKTKVAQNNQVLQQQDNALPDQSKNQRIDGLIRLAAQYRKRGKVRKSIAVLEEARALVKGSDEESRLALVLGGLSDSYLLSRRLELAMNYAKESVAAGRQSTHPTVYATALNYHGNVLMAGQNYNEASRVYTEGILLLQQGVDRVLLVKMLSNRVQALLAMESIAGAIPVLNSAMLESQNLPASHEKVLLLVTLGHLAQRLSQTDNAQTLPLTKSAYTAYNSARTLAESMDDPHGKSYAFGHLGELYVRQERLVDAEQLLRQALFFASQIDAPELLARWYWQLGRLLKIQNKTVKAELAYRKSLHHLATIQPALVYGYRGNPRSFRDTVGTIYLELADILVQKATFVTTQKEQREILRDVRSVMENYKTVELKDYFQDDCVTELRAKIQDQDIDNFVQSGTATLYPIVFADRTVLLVSMADGVIKQFSVPVNATELSQMATVFRKHLVRAGSTRRLRKIGRRLYDWLINPIEPALKANHIDTLVVIPDGILRTIPFSAFYDGDDFLINRYAFTISPGVTLTNAENFATNNPRILLNGLSKSVQQFDALPNVLEEIKKVSSLYPTTELVDEAFIKPNVENQLEQSPYSTVLFATHAQIRSDPKQSFLLTYDDRISLDELDRFMRTAQVRDQPVDLLVLSACETAAGDERAALGLAGVAVKAGANSVVASLWAVNDASTSELIPALFENLKNTQLTKAKALQLAQKMLLKDTRYSHPFFWAPFVLIGNWL